MLKNNNHKINELSAIILAGGQSTRMEYPKAWIKINDITFLETIVTVFKNFGIKDVVVVLNEKFSTSKWKKEVLEIEQNATIIINSNPEKGRLFSLQLGLKAIRNNILFIHNVDNPFIEKSVLELLSNNLELNGITIPSYQGKGGHPVIINQNVQQEITSNYQNYNTLKEVFNHFPKKYIEVNSYSILKNINTPEEFEELKYELA